MPTPSELHPTLHRLADDHAPTFVDIAKEIWADPELGFEEHRAAARLIAPLEAAGFTVERGLAGLDTAFRATWTGQGDGPTIAFLCEYDALRGLGHACGHNLIGTGGMLAGWLLRQAWPDLPGRIQVIGTPAEEGGGGKVTQVDQGVFDEVDAAIMFHPNTGTSQVFGGSLASQRINVDFHGRPAHAAAAPWDGVNALDAMIQFFVGIGLLRQQLRPDTRLHGVITHGGDAANIIPEHTRAEVSVRAGRVADQQVLLGKVEAIAQAAAQATGCSLSIGHSNLYANVVNNMVMARNVEGHLRSLGVQTVDPGPDEGLGSSDVGNVSLVCPTIQPYVSIREDEVGFHTVAFREAANSELGYRRLIAAAKAMASTGADLFLDPALLEAAKAEYRQSMAAQA